MPINSTRAHEMMLVAPARRRQLLVILFQVMKELDTLVPMDENVFIANNMQDLLGLISRDLSLNDQAALLAYNSGATHVCDSST